MGKQLYDVKVFIEPLKYIHDSGFCIFLFSDNSPSLKNGLFSEYNFHIWLFCNFTIFNAGVEPVLLKCCSPACFITVLSEAGDDDGGETA